MTNPNSCRGRGLAKETVAVRKIILSRTIPSDCLVSPQSKQMWLLLRHSDSLSVPAIRPVSIFQPRSQIWEKQVPNYRLLKTGFLRGGAVELCHATIGDLSLDLLWGTSTPALLAHHGMIFQKLKRSLKWTEVQPKVTC